MRDEKIDVVYLWVDESDKTWQRERSEWFKKTFHKNDTSSFEQSYNGDNCELKYSLRSVSECIPWANHIYIITGFNQVPKWLNTKHPKITIVPHSEIMPSDALPTFNSNSIEMCIKNIKGLSDKFILMNDDTFFNKPTSPRFFFDRSGRAIVLYNHHKNMIRDTDKWIAASDNYAKTLILSALKIRDIFGKDLLHLRPSHGIDPYIKSSVIECLSHPGIAPTIEQQIKNRFRTGHELQRWIINLYSYVTGTTVLKKARGYKSGRHWLSNFIYNTMFWRTVRKSPVFCFDATKSRKSILHAPVFCINANPDIDRATLQSNIDFLEQRFPNKSPFEK